MHHLPRNDTFGGEGQLVPLVDIVTLYFAPRCLIFKLAWPQEEVLIIHRP
jgi:hypothetical protein